MEFLKSSQPVPFCLVKFHILAGKTLHSFGPFTWKTCSKSFLADAFWFTYGTESLFPWRIDFFVLLTYTFRLDLNFSPMSDIKRNRRGYYSSLVYARDHVQHHGFFSVYKNNLFSLGQKTVDPPAKFPNGAHNKNTTTTITIRTGPHQP